MKNYILQMTEDAKQANIPLRDLARKFLQAKGQNQSAVKDLIIRYGKTPNPGIIAQAKQAGELIYREAGDKLPTILNLQPEQITSNYRKYKFYNLLVENPAVFIAILTIYEDDAKNEANELIKVASFQGENSVNIPGGVVEDWRYAPGQQLFGKTPQRTPMSISYFRGSWFPQIKNDYEKATGLKAPATPGQGNLEQLYTAAEWIWKLDQAFIDNYNTIKNNWSNKFAIISPLMNNYTYPYNDKGDFKVAKDKNIFKGGKTVGLSIARGPFLLLVDNNVFGLANRIKTAYQTNPQRIIKWWEQTLGGDFSQLEKMFEQGARKKPFLPGGKSSFDPATITTALAAASGILVSINAVLKEVNGAKDELLKTTDMSALNQNKNLPEIGNVKTPWGNFSWGVTNNKAVIIYVALGIIAILGIYYYSRKK